MKMKNDEIKIRTFVIIQRGFSEKPTKVIIFGWDETPQIIAISCSNFNLFSSIESVWSSFTCFIATSWNLNSFFFFFFFSWIKRKGKKRKEKKRKEKKRKEKKRKEKKRKEKKRKGKKKMNFW